MEKWRNFFLQKMGTGSSINESVGKWNIYCKDIPFKIFNQAKAPAKRTWFDEHGDEEYIPSEGLYIEAYSIKVEFGCKCKEDTIDASREGVRENVKAFVKFLRESGMLMMYSSHTGVGRQNVRFESIDDSTKWSQGDDGWWYLIFSVTFKVNDPVTEIMIDSRSTTLYKPTA